MMRQRRQRQALRPLHWVSAALALFALLAFAFLGQPGQVNVLGTGLLCLLPVVDAWRNLTLYRAQDEYERSLMLRSVALAFMAVMIGLAVLGLLGAASVFGGPSLGESVPPPVLIGLFLFGWVVFAASHAVILRRETRE